MGVCRAPPRRPPSRLGNIPAAVKETKRAFCRAGFFFVSPSRGMPFIQLSVSEHRATEEGIALGFPKSLLSLNTPPAPFEIPPWPREVTDEYGVANACVGRKHLNEVIRNGGDELPCQREDRDPACCLAAVNGTQGSCSHHCFCWPLLQRHRRVSMHLTCSSRAGRSAQ